VPDAPSPKDLRGAAAVARTLAYAAGVAGVVVGAILYQQDEVPFAVAIWVLTFAVGALLMIAAFLLQAMTSLLARMAAMESDIRAILARQGPGNGVASPPGGDPGGRGRGNHPGW
jgi:hypothetical protein